VIFTDNATKRYEDFTDKDIASTDVGIGIRYEDLEIQEDTLFLLRYNCPDAEVCIFNLVVSCIIGSRRRAFLHGSQVLVPFI